MKDLHIQIHDETHKQMKELASKFNLSLTKTIRHLVEKEHYILCSTNKKQFGKDVHID